MARVFVLDLDPARYTRHALHGEDRVWVEKNCYIDIWLELVHALELDPVAMLGFCVAVDFEGDQWTFFKPVHDEIRELYGLDVQELNVWRPILEHSLAHVADGKFISTEADAFFLPDTAGTDYKNAHTKTTIVINDVDVERKRLGYFHNAAYHALEGEDFEKLFEVPLLPLFAEVIRKDRMIRRSDDELRQLARGYLRKHFERRPRTNPVGRFGERFPSDLPWLQGQGLAFYHAWAFATIRQIGAAFELLGAHVRWLGWDEIAQPFDVINNAAKTFILKAARAVNAKKPLDAAPMFNEMSAAWQRGMDLLGARL